jgi:hypothetical protein
VKKKIVEKLPRNSAGFFWRRPRPKLGCGAKERRKQAKKLTKFEGNLKGQERYRAVKPRNVKITFQINNVTQLAKNLFVIINKTRSLCDPRLQFYCVCVGTA